MIRNIIFLLCCVSTLFGTFYENKEEIKSKVLYAKYKSYPNIVYTKQRFSVTIEINVLLPQEQFFNINTDFQNTDDIDLLTDEIIWYKGEKNFYKTQLDFKVKNKKFKLPKITITISNKEDEVIDRAYLDPPLITYRKIAINQERYSNVIASDLNIKSVKTRQYSNNELLSVIEIEAKDSNLEDFYLTKYKNQGIKDLKSYDNIQTLLFFVIIPSHLEFIKFDYYNSLDDQFITVEIPIVLKEELVSTQSDLNPYLDSFNFYQKVLLIIIIIIFLMIYYFKRRGKYLLIAIVFIGILIVIAQPNETIVLKKNEKVYILPTSNSTVFKILQENEEVEVLNIKGKFTKVMFKNKNIGWVKNG